MTEDYKPTSLEQYRKDREGKPDAAHVCVVAENGRPVFYYEFEIDFEHDGHKYSFTIWANDADDAAARLTSLRQSATFGGQLMAEFRV